jgi:hypothetical protein
MAKTPGLEGIDAQHGGLTGLFPVDWQSRQIRFPPALIA